MPTLYFVLFRWFPKRLFSRAMGAVAETHWPNWVLTPVIALYRTWVRIDMNAFQTPPEGFTTFNQFFTRSLQPGARPLAGAPDAIACPVDGTVVSLETVREGRLLQTKGKYYTVRELLGDDPNWRDFEGGLALTVYLSPRDYHRIHSPCAGPVLRCGYQPGDLWTVGPLGVRGVPRLFSRNERVVTFIGAPGGEVALVAVGATVVGGIEVVYHPLTTNRPGAAAFAENLAAPFQMKRGAELGRFKLGSTVILLTRPGQAEYDDLQPGRPVLMGQSLGRFKQMDSK